SGVLRSVTFTVEGRAAAPDESNMCDYREASPEYFRVMRIPLIAGRGFTEQDAATTAPVMIVSQRLARRFFPAGAAVGAHLLIDDSDAGPRPVEIVGVVGDVKHQSLDAEPSIHLYLPLRQVHPDGAGILASSQYWLLRTAVDPLTLSDAVRREIRAVDRDVPS